MHGEYKVPGGKLVVVDLEERDGRIADFRLAGDFFLEPDSALDDIDAAVNGLPIESDAAAIARRCAPRCPKARSCSGSRRRRSARRCAARSSRLPAGATSTGRSCTSGRSRRG